MEFTRNTIKRRAEDYVIVGLSLFESPWRDAQNPIPYLRVVAEREKWKSDQIVYGSVYDDHRIVSIDEPIITGDILSAVAGARNFDLKYLNLFTLNNWLEKKRTK